MILLLEILILLVVTIYLFYRWATAKNKTFEERGVPHTKPLPLVGNTLQAVLSKISIRTLVLEFYQRYKTQKIWGFYNFRDPVFVVNDPELIKKITVKDFDHFRNRPRFFNLDKEPLMRNMLSIMEDQRWKEMRKILTPVFTSGKMRNMFPLMNECFDNTLRFLHEKTRSTTDGYEFEMKKCFTRLSNDIIASTAFGLKVNSYENPHNEFYTIGQSVNFFQNNKKVSLIMLIPDLAKLLSIRFIEKKYTDYFMRLVLDTISYREEHKISRPDMIQLLMEAKRESTRDWSDEEIVTQSFMFFFAAFENNSNFICTICYELMQNPDIQQRLYEEVLETSKTLNGAHLDYDTMKGMKYMDMVVSEVLRKWSFNVIITRTCTKDYTLTDEEDNLVFEFKKGDQVWIPIVGLHNDDRYFKDPSIFDPQRFSDDNKKQMNPFIYLSFGAGPRNCIGERFALMQTKAMVYYLVLNFQFEPSSKSLTNAMDEIRGFQVVPRSGFWIRFVAH